MSHGNVCVLCNLYIQHMDIIMQTSKKNRTSANENIVLHLHITWINHTLAASVILKNRYLNHLKPALISIFHMLCHPLWIGFSGNYHTGGYRFSGCHVSCYHVNHCRVSGNYANGCHVNGCQAVHSWQWSCPSMLGQAESVGQLRSRVPQSPAAWMAAYSLTTFGRKPEVRWWNYWTRHWSVLL